MSESPLFGTAENMLLDGLHRQWLGAQRNSLLDFYQPHVRLPDAGFAYLDAKGGALPELGSQLWLGARMMHSFAIAEILGREGAGDIVRHGLDYYAAGPGHDNEYGGWFSCIGGQEPSDRKELYGQAHVLLAASSAHVAGHQEAAGMIDEALDIIDRWYWREDAGLCVEAWDRCFSELDPYRGQNANMHLTEAYLAAHDATGAPVLLERAVRIAGNIAGRAAEQSPGSWRLPEHFDTSWNPIPGFNRDDPRDKFRPYGSQPGHWLEWSKLLLQLKGQGVDEPWVMPAAQRLYDGAFAEAWQPNGGFVYTVDWDGTPLVTERFFWEPAEAIGAARLLFSLSGEQRYDDDYRRVWEYCDEHVIDHVDGSWIPELDDENRPVVMTWPGKPDLYHAFQATLYAETPTHVGLALAARDRSSL